MLSKKLAAVDKTRCVACGVCENTCPLGAVKVCRGCYAAVEAERCVGCGKCAKLCPVKGTSGNSKGERFFHLLRKRSPESKARFAKRVNGSTCVGRIPLCLSHFC